MPLVNFKDLMKDAEKYNYAIGYFESWDLDSLLAVADAAEATKSPVILGINGEDFPNYEKELKGILEVYSLLISGVARKMSVPVCTIFNECPNYDLVLNAVEANFGMVMYVNEENPYAELVEDIKKIVESAHKNSIAVEGDMEGPLGLTHEIGNIEETDMLRYTNVEEALKFIDETGVDSLSINIGQAHIKADLDSYNDITSHLNLPLLQKLKESIPIPLTLHGASSVTSEDIKEAVNIGIRKINVGRKLRVSYFEAIRKACNSMGVDYNPYKVVGSGTKSDIITAGRIALQKTVEEMMHLFGSANRG